METFHRPAVGVDCVWFSFSKELVVTWMDDMESVARLTVSSC